ncbi:MAG: hypothetical protein ACT4NU_02680 [Chromatiales bacterium]
MKSVSGSTFTARQDFGSETSRWSIHTLLIEGARAWSVSPRMVVVISLIVPAVVALAGVVTALMGKATYKRFTGEDGVAESLQVLFFGLALVLGLWMARRLWKSGSTGFALLYLCLSAGLIFFIGEELSWGQRIFGWETPEAFQTANKQDETNIHNIYGVGAAFKWLHVVIGAYGTILPLLVYWRPRNDRHGEAIALLVPHFTLVPYFLATLLWRLQANLWKPPKQLYFVITEYSEVMELMLAIALFMFLLFQFRRTRALEQLPAGPVAL